PLVSQQPLHLLKLWMSYRFPGAGWRNRLTLAGGAQWRSSAYAMGNACTELRPPNALGVSTCAPGKNIRYAYEQDPYAVFSLRAGYRLNSRWDLALNIDNVTDEIYYETTGTSASGNWYGEPRSFTLSLRGTW